MAGLNGNTAKLLQGLVGLGAAALVSYYTAQGAMQKQLAIVDTREQTRWEEVQRRLMSIEASTERSEQMFREVVQDWRRGVDRVTGEPLPVGAAQGR
jgi:hypothetical protein